MNNVELTEKELVTLLELVRQAKSDVEVTLKVYKGDEEIGDYPYYVMSREFEALHILQSKLGGSQ
jgi:hypothetical protein